MKLFKPIMFIVCIFAVALFDCSTAQGVVKQKLVAGADQNFPPYEFIENNIPAGFDIELMHAIAAVMGLDIEVRSGPWSRVKTELESGSIDVLTGMFYSAEREKNLDFSVPHTIVSPGLFVRNDSPVHSFDDIRGKEIIVQQDDFAHEYLKKHKIASRIITVTDAPEAFRMLASGKHDAVFIPSQMIGYYTVKQFSLTNLRSVDTGMTPLQYCFAVKQGNQELLSKLNEGLNILNSTGQYRAIYLKWFGVYEKKNWWDQVRYYIYALELVIALLVVIALWIWSLRHQVKVRTAEIERAQEELNNYKNELEDQVRKRTAQLQEANAELSQYAYVVSHDLRAPLRAIQNYSDFLKEDLDGMLQGDQKLYLDGLGRAAQEAGQQIDDVLELSRIGQRSILLEKIDLQVFMDELIISLKLAQDVEIDMAKDWPVIEAEPVLLRQIFQNLIVNAVKYNTSPLKRVELGWRHAGDAGYEIFVRDNGIGIDCCYQDQIFRVFERLHTRDDYEGTGIGLAIVKKAATRLGGTVRVESEPGKGSTFFVTIPKSSVERESVVKMI